MVKTQLFELLYSPDQQVSHQGYTPLRIDNKRPDWRELQGYIKLFSEGLYANATFTGLFSPKFTLKTKIELTKFLAFSEANTDCDVCFINPFPQIAYYSYNVWMQGECAHAGLIKRAQALLDAVGIAWNLDAIPRQSARTLAYANFWVGNAGFWQGYVGGVLAPISQFLAQNPTDPIVKDLLAPTRHTDPSPYLPFMIERLFSTYLSMNTELRVAAFPIQYDSVVDHYCTNAFERLMLSHVHEEVDAADNLADAFPIALKQKMQMLTELRQQHFFDYYQTRMHPHTGRIVDTENKRN